MEKKSRIGKEASIIIALSMILLITCVPLLSLAVTVRPERWVPYTPSSTQAELTFWTKGEEAYITVAITFYTGGYEIRDWGTVNAKGSEFRADTEIWKSTGPAVQVVWRATHTYGLGSLESGAYTFAFRTWGQTVKTVSFAIGIVPPPTPIIPPPLVPVPPSPIPVTLDLRVTGDPINDPIPNCR